MILSVGLHFDDRRNMMPNKVTVSSDLSIFVRSNSIIPTPMVFVPSAALVKYFSRTSSKSPPGQSSVLLLIRAPLSAIFPNARETARKNFHPESEEPSERRRENARLQA